MGRLGRRWPTPAVPPGQTWIGDDAAVVSSPEGGALLLAADAVVAGVHADLALVGIDDFGWKAMVANVSDLAAMGGEPLWALSTVCGPLGELDRSGGLELLFDGMGDAARAYRCPVVGGDLTLGPVLTVSVAVVGRLGDGGHGPGPRGGHRGPGPVLRSGAGSGDLVAVTGPLGGSAAGLAALTAGVQRPAAAEGAGLLEAHLRPRARVAEGVVARMAGATAMIDVSDGLAADIHHLAGASGVGMELDSGRVPVAAGATLDQALGGGEDYELVFTVPPDRLEGLEAAFSAAALRAPVMIGHCTGRTGELTLGGEPLPRTGWELRW
ncbi:MAG: thiamine-phosphate kinase [Acidimicrobiales bacterium]